MRVVTHNVYSFTLLSSARTECLQRTWGGKVFIGDGDSCRFPILTSLTQLLPVLPTIDPI